jgi:glycosyltransferase involved in cell wall biosynthesis
MESCCLSVMEAMYAGAPVAASLAGGLTEQITHGRDGLLVEVGDEAGWEAALRRLLTDAALRERLGSNARRMVTERFGERDKLRSFRALLRPLLRPLPPLPAPRP